MDTKARSAALSAMNRKKRDAERARLAEEESRKSREAGLVAVKVERVAAHVASLGDKTTMEPSAKKLKVDRTCPEVPRGSTAGTTKGSLSSETASKAPATKLSEPRPREEGKYFIEWPQGTTPIVKSIMRKHGVPFCRNLERKIYFEGLWDRSCHWTTGIGYGDPDAICLDFIGGRGSTGTPIPGFIRGEAITPEPEDSSTTATGTKECSSKPCSTTPSSTEERAGETGTIMLPTMEPATLENLDQGVVKMPITKEGEMAEVLASTASVIAKEEIAAAATTKTTSHRSEVVIDLNLGATTPDDDQVAPDAQVSAPNEEIGADTEQVGVGGPPKDIGMEETILAPDNAISTGLATATPTERGEGAILEPRPAASHEDDSNQETGEEEMEVTMATGELEVRSQELETPGPMGDSGSLAPDLSAAEAGPTLTVTALKLTPKGPGPQPPYVLIETPDLKRLVEYIVREQLNDESFTSLTDKVVALEGLRTEVEGHKAKINTLSEDMGHSFDGYVEHRAEIKALQSGLASCNKSLNSCDKESNLLGEKMKKLRAEQGHKIAAIQARLRALEELERLESEGTIPPRIQDIPYYRREGYTDCMMDLAARGCISASLMDDPLICNRILDREAILKAIRNYNGESGTQSGTTPHTESRDQPQRHRRDGEGPSGNK